MRVGGMHERAEIKLSAAERTELEAVVGNRNSPQKHVWRAKIILLTADGRGSAEIMRRTGKAKTVIWRWQDRFGAAGVAGLWRDKTRPSRIPPTATRSRRARGDLHLVGTAPERHPLDGRGHGQSGRHQRELGAAHLASARPAAAPGASVQAVQ